jgi:uncharacterized protein (TIGR03067 family)
MGALLLAVIAGLGSAPAPDEDAKEEMAKFIGLWKVASETIDGVKTPSRFLDDVVLEFRDGRYIEKKAGDVIRVATFTLDPSKNPKRMDARPNPESTRRPRTLHGIYEFDGDTLKLCLSGRVDSDEYPKEFVSGPRSGFTLLILKRMTK